MDSYQQIFESDLPELEKLVQGFKWATDQVIQYSEAELEVLKALDDQDGLVKAQVKVSTLKFAQRAFYENYLLATGRKAWNE
jgi:hypothetical protein